MDNADISMSIKMSGKCFPDIEKLHRGERIDEGQILDIVEFIDRRYDCADFRMVCILRSLYDYAPLLSAATLEKMEQCVLNFKYWMDEPGEDSMCYWSENHQLLFAVCEYLAGQKFPEKIFPNSGMSGAEHMKKARTRLANWLADRFRFGFVEWHSNTYYEEDIAPLSLLIDLCGDSELVTRAKMILDLLLLDLALHSFQGYFCAASGRCYEVQKKDPAMQDVLDIEKKAFGFHPDREYDYTRLSADFLLNRRYDMPAVLYAIAYEQNPGLICDSHGLDLREVRQKFQGRHGREEEGAFLWAMEAFTNPESVQQTMEMFDHYGLSSNIFLQDLGMIDYPLLRRLHLLPLLVRLLNPITRGVAIQRADTCTCKTAHYMLSTAQAHHPGEFGDQQHIWQATLPGNITVFTSHPAASGFADNARNFSPGYWVGNGIQPHSVQRGNLCLSLYDLRVRRGLLEKQRQVFTHAWLPFERFDEVIFSEGDRLLCARKGESFLALHSLLPMKMGAENELIQRGKVTGWACVTGSAGEYGSWQNFTAFMQSSSLSLSGKCLSFQAASGMATEISPEMPDWVLRPGDIMELSLKKSTRFNGEPLQTAYPRLSCAYGQVEREAERFAVSCGGKKLVLDFAEGSRRTEG